MTRPWLAVILLVIISGILGNKRDVIDVDRLRYDLLQLKDVFKNTGRSDNGPGEGTYLRLIQFYEDFGAELDTAPATKSKHLLSSLNSLWLWARVQAETRSIDGLYATFRQRLHDTNEKRLPFNFEEWTHFAETILKDPNVAVPSAMDRITDIIVQQNLFISAYQVGSEI